MLLSSDFLGRDRSLEPGQAEQAFALMQNMEREAEQMERSYAMQQEQEQEQQQRQQEREQRRQERQRSASPEHAGT